MTQPKKYQGCRGDGDGLTARTGRKGMLFKTAEIQKKKKKKSFKHLSFDTRGHCVV